MQRPGNLPSARIEETTNRVIDAMRDMVICLSGANDNASQTQQGAPGQSQNPSPNGVPTAAAARLPRVPELLISFQSAAPVFALSSLSTYTQKAELTQAIRSLGGVVSKTCKYDPSCHAVITSYFSRNEKIAACIAAGKYVLKPDYITKSREAGHFISDSQYLWRGTEREIYCERDRELVRAAVGWLKVKGYRRPMQGFRFYVGDSKPEKVAALERLIVAGGGQVVGDMGAANCVLMRRREAARAQLPASMRVEDPKFLDKLILDVPGSG